MNQGDPKDRRRYRRLPLTTRVDVVSDDVQGFTSQLTADVSEGGMFILSSDPLPVGTIIGFGLRPRRGFAPVRGHAEVMWVDDGEGANGSRPGMGLRFVSLGREGRETIRSLLVFESGVEIELAPDEPAGPAAAPTQWAPVVTPELRELSDVFPPPGETGVGFFAVQEAADRRAAEAAEPSSRRAFRWSVIVVSLLVVGAVGWLLWSQRAAGLPQWHDGRPANGGGAPLQAEPADDVDRQARAVLEPLTEPAAEATPTPAPATALVDVVCSSDAVGAVVTIRGNGRFLDQRLRFEALHSPPRFVIRILGIVHPFRVYDSSPAVPQVISVRVGHHPELEIPQLYVVLDLAAENLRALPPEIDGDELVIRVLDPAADLS